MGATEDLSQAQLVEFSDRLLDSIQLYFGLARLLTRIRLEFDSAPAWETETAMVESFALHTRGLADFFFTVQGSKNSRKRFDAWAIHYFMPTERWAEIVGLPGPWLRRVYLRPSSGVAGVDRFGAQIAHLNYREPPASELARGWPVMQIANDLALAVAAFVRNVEPALVGASFCDKVWRQLPVGARLNRPLLPLATWTRPALRPRPR